MENLTLLHVFTAMLLLFFADQIQHFKIQSDEYSQLEFFK